MSIIGFRLTSNLFLRDPQTSELGQSIIAQSIELIDKIGFDQFTFKKLGTHIGSPEASVYRYFGNKHRLLLYLIDWYWTWLDYRMEFRNQNIRDPRTRLRNCIHELVDEKVPERDIPFVDEQKLQRIVHSEFEKTYLTRQVDADNRKGLFLPYKSIATRIGSLIQELNPRYPYARSLASTVMLSANHQLYYARHLPSLTNIKADSKQRHSELIDFLESLIIKTINAGLK